MAIYLDTSESRSTSRMPSIPDATSSDVLEAISGADVMVSPLSLPVTNELLIKKHARSGAIFIQRKSLSDMITSILDESINISIARMREIGTKSAWQRIIMSTGVFVPDVANEGVVMIGEPQVSGSGDIYIHLRYPEVKIGYKSYATIRRRIAMRGAFYLPLTCDEEIPGELRAIEKDLLYLAGKPVKELFAPQSFPPDLPLEDDPLQELREVEDGRKVIAAFRDIGPVKASALWDAIRKYNEQQRPLSRGWSEKDWEPRLKQAIFWASVSDPKLFGIPKVRLWSEKSRQKVRDQLGMEEGENFRVMLDR